MDSASLTRLVADLFGVIQGLSGYPAPAVMPEVHRVSHQVIQEKFCNGACRVRAAYHPEWGVYIDERLDLERSTFDRSVLLHELVHHVQASAGYYEGRPDDCERATREEREAYAIQNRYLSSLNDWRRLPLPQAVGGC